MTTSIRMQSTERPILFSAPMVRALLDGAKTQTRRIMKPQLAYGPVAGLFNSWYLPRGDGGGVLYPNGKEKILSTCPYGQPGDRLWVREAHSIFPTHGQHRADGERWGPWGGLPTALSPDGKQIAYFREGFDRCDPGRWRPSIHMPRWASRITLEITSVRVERLQGISASDAIAEGVNVHPDHHGKPCASIYGPMQAYRDLWERINGPNSWDENPWVWVIEFRRLEAGA